MLHRVWCKLHSGNPVQRRMHVIVVCSLTVQTARRRCLQNTGFIFLEARIGGGFSHDRRGNAGIVIGSFLAPVGMRGTSKVALKVPEKMMRWSSWDQGCPKQTSAEKLACHNRSCSNAARKVGPTEATAKFSVRSIRVPRDVDCIADGFVVGFSRTPSLKGLLAKSTTSVRSSTCSGTRIDRNLF